MFAALTFLRVMFDNHIKALSNHQAGSAFASGRCISYPSFRSQVYEAKQAHSAVSALHSEKKPDDLVQQMRFKLKEAGSRNSFRDAVKTLEEDFLKMQYDGTPEGEELTYDRRAKYKTRSATKRKTASAGRAKSNASVSEARSDVGDNNNTPKSDAIDEEQDDYYDANAFPDAEEDDNDDDEYFDANNIPEFEEEVEEGDCECAPAPLMMREAKTSERARKKAKKQRKQLSDEVSDASHAEFLKKQKEAADKKAAEEAAGKRGENEAPHERPALDRSKLFRRKAKPSGFGEKESFMALEEPKGWTKGPSAWNEGRLGEYLLRLHLFVMATMYVYTFAKGDITWHQEKTGPEAEKMASQAMKAGANANVILNDENSCVGRDNFLNVLHEGTPEFEKHLEGLGLDAECVLGTTLELKKKGDKAIKVGSDDKDTRNNVRFDAGHAHCSFNHTASAQERGSVMVPPKMTHLDEKHRGLHLAVGDVLDRIQDVMDDCCRDRHGRKTHHDKERDSKFASELRRLCGSTRSRAEAFSIGVSEYGSVEEWEELQAKLSRQHNVGRHMDGPNDFQDGHDVVGVSCFMLVCKGKVYRLAVIAHSRVSIGTFCDKEYGYVREATKELLDFEKEDLYQKFSLKDAKGEQWESIGAGKLRKEELHAGADTAAGGVAKEPAADAEDAVEKKDDAMEDDDDNNDNDGDAAEEDDAKGDEEKTTKKRKLADARHGVDDSDGMVVDGPERSFEEEHASTHPELDERPRIRACLHFPPFMDPSGYMSIFTDQILLLQEKCSWIEEDELVQLLLIVLHSNGTPLFKFITDLWLQDTGWSLKEHFVGSPPGSPVKTNLWKQYYLDLRALGFAAFSSTPKKYARHTSAMNSKTPSDKLEESLVNLKKIICLAEMGLNFNKVIELLSKKSDKGGVHYVSTLTALPFYSVAVGVGLLTSKIALENSMGAVMSEKNTSIQSLSNFKPEKSFADDEPELDALMAVKFGFTDNKENRATLLKRLSEWLERPIFHIENGLCKKYRGDKKFDIFYENQSLCCRRKSEDGTVRLHRKRCNETTWTEHTPKGRTDGWFQAIQDATSDQEKSQCDLI